uniref:Sigma factor n=1 Tax=Pelargonium hortorum TaxID=4031 RepID=A0A0G2SYD3_PELHO|nr:sigma factor [Pelargonium x hortorum]
METASNFLAPPPPFPPRTPSRKCASSTSAAPAVTSVPTASLARSFPTSVLLQEQRDEYKPLLHILKEDKLSQVTLDRRHMLTGTSGKEEDPGNSEQLVQNLEHQFLDWPGLYPLLPPSNMHKDPSLSSIMQSATVGMKLEDVEPSIALALAKKALSASKQAAMLYEDNEILEDDLNGSLSYSLGSTSSIKLPLEREIAVRSTRLQERRSKKRRASKLKDVVLERYRPNKVKAKRKTKTKTKQRGLDQNVPFPQFSSHQTKLLTNKEELTLIAQIQDFKKLEEVRSELQSHIGREPTLAEWSGVVGLSCRVLQSQIDSSNRCRQRLISANLGLVVHVARKYLSSGVSLPDLFQAGRSGLITSIDRFKPQAGSRFSTYAYWWIRQSVRKSIFEHGRLIRLPEHVHALLSKVSKARRLLIEEGISDPTDEQVAKRVNITTEKLMVLQNRAREPISLQQKVGAESNVSLEAIAVDHSNPDPEEAAVNELMMQHVRNLIVTTLEPRERQIVRLRFGIGGGRVNTLTEVGEKLGLSRERVRQLQDQSLGKLKQGMESAGADEFRELLYT